MAEEKLVKAVREIERSAVGWVVQKAARDALSDGSNEALNRALITTRECATSSFVIDVANQALGFKK